MKKDKNQPDLYLRGENKPCRAAGIIPYRKVNGKIEILLIKNKRGYEDFGGRTDIKDQSIYQTARREAQEESNHVLSDNFLKEATKSNSIRIFVPHNKYVVFIHHVDRNYSSLEFGNLEIHDNIPRTVEWIPLTTLFTSEFLNQLNPRLKSYSILRFLQLLS